MEKPTPIAEPLFLDDQSGLTERLPIFVTRTTLGAILNKHEAKKSSGFGAEGASSEPAEQITSNTTVSA
ncbi:hypothetical protein B1F69_22680 [Pseudomonas syringae]|jgi:hypothetical protein|uniref:hypothetical protein n=1 Tax=Pseudomonas syringae TaxID=317 RepID=UPI00101168F6|nr:hypothetical protein [Pseudomonas syringae]RXT87079.1 hypothetical protein B1F69_22680 [Pseudomonas syringae]